MPAFRPITACLFTQRIQASRFDNSTVVGEKIDESEKHVVLEGDLDFSRQDEIMALLPDPPLPSRLVIDCTKLDSVDSTILTVLLRFRRRVLEAGDDPTKIVLIVRKGSLRQLLEIAGLPKLLTVITT